MTRPFLIGSAAVLATLLAAPSLAVAQPTTPDQNQTEMNSDQPQGGGGGTNRKRMNQNQPNGDQQSGDEGSRDQKRGNRSQSGSKDRSDDDSGKMSRRYDRDRHGDRRRGREGRYRYFHEGYYYATPWWTVGPGVVIGGRGGIGCREGARIASRRGFNRVRPIDCGGETYRYEGWRGGAPWRIRIDSDTGAIISARPGG